MVEGVKALGMETCVTLGMLTSDQARRLKDCGLDYYNHNLDTSPEFYGEIITTRTYQDRLDTLEHVRDAGIHVCCGGIVGMGEGPEDRIGMIATLAGLPVHPESVPINMLVQVEGTPLAGTKALDPLEFVRTIAVARICMPESVVRLSAGREDMTEETQALCFLAGANSIFYGPKLLTTPNPGSRPRHGAPRQARHEADGLSEVAHQCETGEQSADRQCDRQQDVKRRQPKFPAFIKQGYIERKSRERRVAAQNAGREKELPVLRDAAFERKKCHQQSHHD